MVRRSLTLAHEDRPDSPFYRCRCGQLRCHHVNGSLCTFWLPPAAKRSPSEAINQPVSAGGADKEGGQEGG